MEKTNKNHQNKFKNCVTALMIIFCMCGSFAQTVLYPSSAGGNWAAGNSWSTASCGGTACGTCYPSGTGFSVTMSCANKTITAAGTNPMGCATLTLSNGTLVVNSSSTVSVTTLTMSGGTLTVNGTLFVTGNVSITGGNISGTGQIVLGGTNQNISSTIAIPQLNVTGTGIKTMTGNVTVSNTLSLTAAVLAVGSNTLTVGTSSTGTNILGTNGRILTTSLSSLSFGGAVVKTLSAILSNTGAVTLTNFSLTKSSAEITLGTSQNLTVSGAFNLSAGEFAIGANILTLNGAISGSSNGIIRGSATSDLVINGTATANMFFDETSNTTNTIRNFTNNRSSNSIVLLSSLRIGGVLAESANSSISLANTTLNPLVIEGTVSGTAALIGNTNASLSILGSGSLGGTLTFSSSPTLDSLLMNRSNGTATIGSAISVDDLTLTSGVLTNANLTTITGNTPAKIVNTNAASYLAGPMARTIGANSNGAAYVFPIGKTASQKLSFNGLNTGNSGNVIIRAEAFDGNNNGTFDATMVSRNTDNYWSASATANATNLISLGTVSLNDAAIALESVIGYAPTQNGTYTSLGGTIISQTITSVSDAPVALGFYNLGVGGNACTDADTPTVSATSTANCGPLLTTLSVDSGALNSATNWIWYSGTSCGIGTAIGTGTSINVTPNVTTTYWVRGEGGCTTAVACASLTISVSPQTVGGIISGETGVCLGTPSSQLTLSGYTGNIIRWESAVSPFTDWSTINNTSATYTSGNLNEGTRFRAIVKSGICPEAISTPITVSINQVTFGAASTEIVCPNTEATVSVTGLVPASVSNVTYIKNPGGVQSSAEVTANEFGAGIFKVLVTGSGQRITITSITRTDSNPDCAFFPATNNIVIFPVASGCTQVSTQCGQELPAIDTYVYANLPSPGGQSYIWRITTLDGNAFPVANLQPQLISTSLRNLKFTQMPVYAFNTNYRVEVSVVRNGLQGPFGRACVVKTPSATTQLSVCNADLSALNSTIYAGNVPFATGYRFTVTEAGGPTGIILRPIRDFKLTSIPDFMPKYGTTYTITVAVRNTDGSYLAEGPACSVSTPVYPTTVMAQSDEVCDAGYEVPTSSTQIYAVSVAGAVAYEFTISGPTGFTSIIKPIRSFMIRDFTTAGASLTPGVSYSVWVKPVFDPAMTSEELLAVPSGHACSVIIPANGAAKETLSKDKFSAVAYPNPFADNFNIEVVTPWEEKIFVKVYDMTGRLLDVKTAAAGEIHSLQVGNQYPSGVYNVIVTQGEAMKVLRVVKR